MRRRIARAAGVALLLAATVPVLAPPAVAAEAPPTAKTGAAPSFATLPEGHVPGLPAAVPPAHVPAREKTPGFTTASMPAEQAKQMRLARQSVGFSYLFADEEQAKAFVKSQGSGESKVDACLVDGGNAEALKSARGGDDDAADDEPHDWQSSYSSMLSFQFDTNPAPPGGQIVVRSRRRARSSRGGDVHAVHSERFVATADGRASLEVADAWFDARTSGMRLLGRTALPMVRVFSGPNGLDVYAARDGDALQVVLHAPDHPSEDAGLSDQLRARLRNMFVTLPDRNSGNADCGHLRFTLRAPAGVGQMATLQSAAFFAPLDADSGEVPDEETEAARGS
ncbi:MAG TPA: hypothetical protein VHS09_11330, partial [Polyangiaceae bacterium]|nr:hypothetical protein [Polyangiaceae bacterium]